MPFEIGNQLAVGRQKPKPYAAALNMEIKAAGDDMKALRKVARAHLRRAESGDIAAIKELADRLDGKVPQAVVGDDEHPPAFAAWLAWMQILQVGDTHPVSPNANDINGIASAGQLIEHEQPASAPPSDPAGGGNLVPSSEEETSAP